MYMMIHFKIATMYELKEVYTLDEALNVYAFYNMQKDIEGQEMEKMEEQMRRAKK